MNDNNKLIRAVDAGKYLLTLLDPSQDRVGIVTFGWHEANLLLSLTLDLNRLKTVVFPIP